MREDGRPPDFFLRRLLLFLILAKEKLPSKVLRFKLYKNQQGCFCWWIPQPCTSTHLFQKRPTCHQSSLSHHTSSSTRFVSAAAKREYKSSASRGTQAVRESPPQAMEGKSCTNLAWWLSHGFVGKNKQSQGGSGPFEGALKHHHNQLLTSS